MNIFRQEVFQGAGKTKHYFEGWYFKIVDKEAKNILAVIPGISIEENIKKSHCFIQIMDAIRAESFYMKYDVKAFDYSKNKFLVSIDGNHFSERSIALNINKKNFNIKGRLDFKGLSPWPKSIMSPGAMGWYSYIPFMECYHGVISMDHSICGVLTINGENIDYEGGRGYIEKDWGKSFPQGWIWAQTNHFSSKKTSIMLSVAKIPFKKSSFTGFICGLMINEKFYKFATYTGAKIKNIAIENNKGYVWLENKNHSLKIQTINSKGATLASPEMGAMAGRINESIDALIKVELYDKRKDKIIFKDESRLGALEVVNPQVLL